MLQDTLSEEELIIRRILPRSYRDRLPFVWKEDMMVLGAILDPRLTFRAHMEGVLSRAKVRHGVMSTVAGQNWGLETNVLRITNSALLVSLTR